MAFVNRIKGLGALGIIASVEGNERTLAANAGNKARRDAIKHRIEVPKVVVIPMDAWEKELMRLGF